MKLSLAVASEKTAMALFKTKLCPSGTGVSRTSWTARKMLWKFTFFDVVKISAVLHF